ncbi:MAG TPA: ABC transporter permease [Flavobacteriales bacterium]|jgi:ABC-2 type transport system permease protein|nr:ABC transporter permease [Flavobacteriales bacterium]|tara:strand:+ start:3944 stop:5215 length:1272 start_codon:yes stop_codon:yes gene_type:complete
MNKIWLIIKREYLVRVRKRSFIIMTILGPLLIAGIIILPTYLAMQGHDERIIALYEENTFFSSKLEDTDNLHFVKIPFEEVNIIKEDFSASSYYALLDIKDAENFALYSNQQVSLSVQSEIEGKLSDILQREELKLAGIDLQILEGVTTQIEVKTIIIGEEGETTGNAEVSFGIGFMCGILIYMFIFMYGTMVMRGVIEEKTSRIVEVIISSVKPFQLMMGKILGVALVGLTQFMLWIILTIIISSFAEVLFFDMSAIAAENSEMGQEQSVIVSELLKSLAGINIAQLLISFVFYFLGGYLLYSALFAAVGSAVDAEADTQQFILPITIPLILSFILMQPVMNNPDGVLAYWLSLIPFTSPIIMMVRLPFGVSNAELILSMALLVVGFLATTSLAAKIYRTGILMYGKKASYKELWKWLTFKG